MRKILCCFYAFMFSLTFYSQEWSLPKDNKKIEKIDWATPIDYDLNFNYPFKAYEYFATDLLGRSTGKILYKPIEGTYTLRIPNRFKNSSLPYDNQSITWLINTPDSSAGYTEAIISYSSNCTSEIKYRPLKKAAYEGDVFFLTDVIINGTKAFPKGPKEVWKGLKIGYNCYPGTADAADSFPQAPMLTQSIYNSNTELYYQFVRAKDASNVIILWGIFSKSSRYKN